MRSMICNLAASRGKYHVIHSFAYSFLHILTLLFNKYLLNRLRREEGIPGRRNPGNKGMAAGSAPWCSLLTMGPDGIRRDWNPLRT